MLTKRSQIAKENAKNVAAENEIDIVFIYMSC